MFALFWLPLPLPSLARRAISKINVRSSATDFQLLMASTCLIPSLMLYSTRGNSSPWTAIAVLDVAGRSEAKRGSWCWLLPPASTHFFTISRRVHAHMQSRDCLFGRKHCHKQICDCVSSNNQTNTHHRQHHHRHTPFLSPMDPELFIAALY